MPLYEYSAINSGSKKIAGIVEAGSEKEAKEKLREQMLYLVSLSLKKTSRGKENLKGDQLVAFTMLLSQLAAGGVPLYESLVAIEEQYKGESCHRIILSLCDRIKGGASLSQAMASHPESFDKLYCSMVAAGELSGALDQTLEELGQLLKRQGELKKKISTALIYPGVLAGFSMIVLVALLTFVVPSIESIFEDRQVNNFTASVLWVSYIFRNYWWLLLGMVGGGAVCCLYYFRSPSGKAWLERTLLRLPLFGRIVLQGALTRFCRTMATLLGGGVTLIDSLRVARQVMRNDILEEEILRAEQKVIEGSSLSKELKRSLWIPPLVSRMVAVGEESGTTAVMLQRVSQMYETELEKTLDRLVALAQPVILIVMGGIIGIVLLAVLLPMADFSALTME